MAVTCTHRVITPDTGNTPNTSGSITFATGDLLVVFVTKEASALSSPMVSGDLTATSITGVSSFTLIRNQGHQSSAAHMGVFVADQKTTGSGTTGTVTIASGADAGAGTIISVYTVAGMPASNVGATAVRQSGGQTDQGAGTPAPVFGAAALTGNACLGAIYNATNPAGMTEPSGWSAGGNSGYTTGQVSGLGTCHRNSGETGTTITWGSASASAFASIIIELSTTVPGAATQALTFGSTTVGKLFKFGAATQALTSTLTSQGRGVRFGQATQALTATLTSQGTRALRGQSVLSFAASLTTQGKITVFGAATQALVFDSTTSGDVGAGGETLFGASVLDLTANLTTSGHLAQLALAAQDSVDGAWTTQDGGSDLRAAVDEPVFSDADYIRSELQPDNSACRIKLQALSDPATDTGHVLRWRIAKDAADGATVNMTLTLYEGGGDVLGAGTEIASFIRSDVSEAFTSFEEHLSEAEASLISDYGNLYVELLGDVA